MFRTCVLKAIMSKRLLPIKKYFQIFEALSNAVGSDLILLIHTHMDVVTFYTMKKVSKWFRQFLGKASVKKMMGVPILKFLSVCKPCGLQRWIHNCFFHPDKCVIDRLIHTIDNRYFIDDKLSVEEFSITLGDDYHIYLSLRDKIYPNWDFGHTKSCDRYRLIDQCLYYEYEAKWYCANRFVNVSVEWMK